jgi:hypothetical protein
MIRYALRCDRDHSFESWFSDMASFDMQAKRGFVVCPICQSSRVTRDIMAPRIVTSRKKAAAPDTLPAVAASATMEAVFDGDAAAMREMVRGFRKFVTDNTEDVGKAFAEESRKMHYGEVDSRAIRGEATGEDVRELLEEGISILPLPVLPEDRN